ncbi:MAG: DUF4920 domain-containing protein [Candidatus Kapabacteria bacterium]|nr:DUF4920 domain-containing protein [Candidatus Kapabacteria bacterium]
MLRFVIMLLVAFGLTACSKEPDMGQRIDMTRTPISVTQALDPTGYGRTVLVEGTVAEVCQTEGCWMNVSDGKSAMRVTFKDEAFAVPVNLTGKVMVEGVVREEIEESGRVPVMVATGVARVDQ